MNKRGQDDGADLFRGIIGIIVIIIIIIYIGKAYGWWIAIGNFFKTLFKWLGILVLCVLAVIIIAALIYGIYRIFKYNKEKKERERIAKFEKEQEAKGLIKYKDQWYTPEKLNKVKEIEKKEQEKREKEEREEKRLEEIRQKEENKRLEREAEIRYRQKEKERKEEEIETKVELKIKYATELKSLSKEDREIFLNKKYKEIVKEQEKKEEKLKKRGERKSNIDYNIQKIVEYLEEYPTPKVRDEKELERNIYSYLKGRVLDMDIKFQQRLETGGKIDILIDDEIGVELKIAETRTHLRDLIGQIEEYLQVFDKLLVVILDVGSIPQEEIEEYCDKFQERGAITCVIKGQISRRMKSSNRKS